MNDRKAAISLSDLKNRSENSAGYRAHCRTASAVGLVRHFILQGRKGKAESQPITRQYQPNPSSAHIASTRTFTLASIVIGVPHSRWVSPGHLFVASMPILLPRPDTGLAKSR
jgi:hypothetical protein